MSIDWEENYTAKATIGEAELFIHKTATNYMWTIWQGRTRLAVGTAKTLKGAKHQIAMKALHAVPK